VKVLKIKGKVDKQTLMMGTGSTWLVASRYKNKRFFRFGCGRLSNKQHRWFNSCNSGLIRVWRSQLGEAPASSILCVFVASQFKTGPKAARPALQCAANGQVSLKEQ